MLLCFVGKARLLRLRDDTGVKLPDLSRIMLPAEIERLLVQGKLFLEWEWDVLGPVAIDFHRGFLVQRLGQAGDDLQARLQRRGAVLDFDGFKDLGFDGEAFLIGGLFCCFGPVPGVGECLKLCHVAFLLCYGCITIRLWSPTRRAIKSVRQYISIEFCKISASAPVCRSLPRICRSCRS